MLKKKITKPLKLTLMTNEKITQITLVKIDSNTTFNLADFQPF